MPRVGDGPCLSSVPAYAGMIISCLQIIKPPQAFLFFPLDFRQPPHSGGKMVSAPYLCAKETQFHSVGLLHPADKGGPFSA